MYKVKMHPSAADFKKEESGIRRVVEAYTKNLPKFGFEITRGNDYDVSVSHAGSAPGADVVCVHGLYWTADYRAAAWEWHVNRDVINSVRLAKEVTVPSRWVQEVFQRDMRFNPTVLHHGVDADDWRHTYKNEGYVLWNKNRDADVCSPEPMVILANQFPDIKFISTFAPHSAPTNVKVTGLLPHHQMKKSVQKAAVYLSSTKETFGIGTLEALAAGTPVLGFRHGGNIDIVEHGSTGYLATPGDYEELAYGLRYCLKYRNELSANAKESARLFTWDNACEILVSVLLRAMQVDDPNVSVIIPAYNKADTLERAVNSVLAQTVKVDNIVIVNDGSKDDTEKVANKISAKNRNVKVINKENGGVATARNIGAEAVNTKYICFLDADDRIEPEFLETCVNALDKDRSLHLAYTRLKWVKPDGSEGISNWPGEWDYNAQLRRKNQVPTCNVMRKSTFDRLGGYNKRYCPTGAGSEDAELWTRFGAYGYKAALVDERPLFQYSFLSGHTAQSGYSEMDWLIYAPYAHDNIHPFASYANTGKMPSHAVRQYDDPTVSIIIPVGQGHADLLDDALHSIDGQTYRNWEAILVWDSTESDEKIRNTYPFARVFHTDEKPSGAGKARNIGAKNARGKFLLFLDADDWLYPDALSKMLLAWEKDGSIVYSDYVGKATITAEYASELGDRLIFFDENNGSAVIRFNAQDYDCQKAQMEPNDISRPYIWNLITSLIPKVWHDDIGGFDENMLSWEDWDYWLRLAHAGKCFARVTEPLVVYRFYTGTRRDIGVKHGKSLVKYLVDKYKDKAMAPCGCGKKPNIKAESSKSSMNNVSGVVDDNMILIKYASANRGQHLVVGHLTGRKYGYRAGGEVFYVLRKDAEAAPNLFVPVQKSPTAPDKRQIEELSPPKTSLQMEDDTSATTKFDFTKLPGITPKIAEQIERSGIDNVDDLMKMTARQIATSFKGVGEKRAEAILAYLNMNNRK